MKTWTYLERLHAMREQAYDEARRALDECFASPPGTSTWPGGWVDGWARYDAWVSVRDLLTRESDRTWDDGRQS